MHRQHRNGYCAGNHVGIESPHLRHPSNIAGPVLDTCKRPLSVEVWRSRLTRFGMRTVDVRIVEGSDRGASKFEPLANARALGLRPLGRQLHYMLIRILAVIVAGLQLAAAKIPDGRS